MTKKASKLINENVIRRWGKLANMPALTENFIDSLEDETVEEAAHEDEMDAAEDEIAAGEDEMEAGMEAEASMEEKEAVEDIVRAVVDAIAAETGVDIEVEGEAGDEEAMDDMDAGMDASDEMDADADRDMDDDPAMGDTNLRMRDPMNRTDEKKDMNKAGKKDDATEDERLGMVDGPEKDKKQSMKDRRKEMRGAKNEELELEVIDDEALTEAVLSRVVERLLKKN